MSSSHSLVPNPNPQAFGAFDSNRYDHGQNWSERFDSKPDNTIYHLSFQNYYVQHLCPSPDCKSYQFQPSYTILHQTVPPSFDRDHDINILRADFTRTGGVALAQYLVHHRSSLVTYAKTGLTQDVICDPRRWGDDSAGNVVHLRDYLVHIGHESCVWQPLGPAAVSTRDGTVFGLMELRTVTGKLCATLGSEQSDEHGVLKRHLMVRGEWAPGGANFEQVVASLITMLGRERERIRILRQGGGAVLP